MKKQKEKPKYRGFSLSVPLIEEINKTIADNDEYKRKYKSTADFVREAVREKLITLYYIRPLSSSEKYFFYDLMKKKRIEAMNEAMELGEKINNRTDRKISKSIFDNNEKKKSDKNGVRI